PATNLVKLLELPASKELIARKVKVLCVAAWRGGAGASDGASARKLFAEWPTPIVAVPKEVGEALLVPAVSMAKEFAWAPDHPIVDAWRAAGGQDAPSWALAAGLQAVRTEGFFTLSEPGTILVGEDGKASFTPSAQGKHRNLKAGDKE